MDSSDRMTSSSHLAPTSDSASRAAFLTRHRTLKPWLLWLVALILVLAGVLVWRALQPAPTSARVVGTQIRSELFHNSDGSSSWRVVSRTVFLTRTLTDVPAVQHLYSTTEGLPKEDIVGLACGFAPVVIDYQVTFYQGSHQLLESDAALTGCTTVGFSGEKGLRRVTPDYISSLQQALGLTRDELIPQ